ncbi:conserved Plasmodium protein, unknown function [Plasmodium chabaudi adami]|uniref:Uncharacterized protein n=1 Tax=Plasmodium chabaudi adami TaxID=5826 RepID=A0A1D3LJR7_PLACE|nr:conserved Plasmodium protein, unknown function [Plasmodium chabaudi adami]
MANVILDIFKQIAINYSKNKYVKGIQNIFFESLKHIIIEELELNKFCISNIFNDDIINNYVKNADLKLSEINLNDSSSKPKNKFTDYLTYLHSLNDKKNELQFNLFFCDKIEIDWDGSNDAYFYDGLLLSIENVYVLLSVVERVRDKASGEEEEEKEKEEDEEEAGGDVTEQIAEHVDEHVDDQCDDHIDEQADEHAPDQGDDQRDDQADWGENWVGMLLFFAVVCLNFLKDAVVEVAKCMYYLITLLVNSISYVNLFKKLFLKVILENVLSINIKNMNIIFEDKIGACEKNMFLSMHVQNLSIDNYNYIKNKKHKIKEPINERLNKNLNGYYNFGKINNSNKIQVNENEEYLKISLTNFSIYYDLRSHLISDTDINIDKNKFIFFYNYNINFMHKRNCLVNDINFTCIISKSIKNNQNFAIDLIISSFKINFMYDKFYELFLFIYKYAYLLSNTNSSRDGEVKKSNKLTKHGYLSKTTSSIEFNVNIDMFKIVFCYNYYNNLQIILKDINFFLFFVKKEWKRKSKTRHTWATNKNPIVSSSYILKDFIFFIESFTFEETYSKLSLTMNTKKEEYIYMSKRNMNIKRIQYNSNFEYELLEDCNLESKLNRYINVIPDRCCKKNRNENAGHSLAWSDNRRRDIYDKTYLEQNKKYSFYFRIYKKEKGTKNCYINNIYVYIENVYLKIKNLNNICSLINNIPDKFFFIFYYIISAPEKRPERVDKVEKCEKSENVSKKHRLPHRPSDTCLNVRLNFIEIELKNKNVASIFFCMHNLGLYNGYDKSRPYRRHNLGLNLFQKKIAFCKITNIYSYVQCDKKITHVLFYPFNLFFTIHNHLKNKMKIEILSLVIELNKNVLQIVKDIFCISDSEENSVDIFYDCEKNRKKNRNQICTSCTTSNNELPTIAHKENAKFSNAINEYDNFITLSNELNILFSCIDTFFDVINFEESNKEDEKYDVNSSFSITSVLNLVKNVNVFLSLQHVYIYFFFNNNLGELGKKGSNKTGIDKSINLKRIKKKNTNMLSFFSNITRANSIESLVSLTNANANKHMPTKLMEMFYIKWELKNMNFFFHVKDNYTKNKSSEKYSILCKFKIASFRALYNFYFSPINLETFVMNGLCVYILKDSSFEKELIKIENVENNEDSKKHKKSMFILNKCMLEYVNKENTLISRHKWIIDLTDLNIFIYDFFVNIFYYIYRNRNTTVFAKPNEKGNKTKMKSNSLAPKIITQSSYTKILKRINICNNLLIAKNIFKVIICFAIKRTNIFFIFYNKINEDKTDLNSDPLSKYYNTHLSLQINSFFTKLKSEFVHIKLRNTPLSCSYNNVTSITSNDLSNIQSYFHIFKPRAVISLKGLALTMSNRLIHGSGGKTGETTSVVTKYEHGVQQLEKIKEKVLIKIEEINIKMINLHNSMLFLNLHKITLFNYLNFIETLNIYLQLFAKTFKSTFFAKYFLIPDLETQNEYMIELAMNDKQISPFKNYNKSNEIENDELGVDKNICSEDITNSGWIEMFYKMCIFKKIVCCVNIIKHSYTLYSPIVNSDRKKNKKEIFSLKINKIELILKRNDIKNLNKYISHFKYNMYIKIYGVNIFIKKLKKKYILLYSNLLYFFNQINGYIPRNDMCNEFENYKIKKRKRSSKSCVLYKNSKLKYICWKNSSIALFFKINRQVKRKIGHINDVKKNNSILNNLQTLRRMGNKLPISTKFEFKSYENRNRRNESAFYLFLNEETLLSIVNIYVNVVNLFEGLKKIPDMWMEYSGEVNKNEVYLKKNKEIEKASQIETSCRDCEEGDTTVSVSFLQCLESLKVKVKNIFFLFYEYNMKMFIGFYLKEINNTLYIDQLKKKKNNNECQYYFKYIHKLTDSVLFTNNIYFNSNKNIYIFDIFNNLVNKNNLSYLKGMFYFLKKQKIDPSSLFLRKKKVINNMKKKRHKEYNEKNNKIQNLAIWWDKQLKIEKKNYKTLKNNNIIKTESPLYTNTNMLLHKIIQLNKKRSIITGLNIPNEKFNKINKNQMIVYVKYYLKNKNTFIHIETKPIFKNVSIYFPLYAIIELNKMIDALRFPLIYRLYLSTITDSQNYDNNYNVKQKKCDISFDFKVCLTNFKIYLLSACTYSITNIKENDLSKNEIEFIDDPKKNNKGDNILNVQKSDYNNSAIFERKLEKQKKKKVKGKDKNGTPTKSHHLGSNSLKQRDVKKNKNEIEKEDRNNMANERDEENELENKQNEMKMDEISKKKREFLYVFVLKTDINIDIKNKNKKKKIKRKVINNSKKNQVTFVNKLNINVSFTHLNVTSGLLYIWINEQHFLFNVIRIPSLFKSVYEYNNSSKYYFNMSRDHKFRLKRNENLISQIENKNNSKITTKMNKIKFIVMREYCTYNTIDIMNILLFFQNTSYFLNLGKPTCKKTTKHINSKSNEHVKGVNTDLASSYEVHNNRKRDSVDTSQRHISSNSLDIYSPKKNEAHIDSSKRESYYYEEKETIGNKRIVESSHISYNNEVIKLENNLNGRNKKERYRKKGMKKKLKNADEALDKALCANEKKSLNVNYCLNSQKKKAISKKNVNVIIGSMSIYINNNDLLILNLLREELLFIQKRSKGGKVEYSCKYNYNGVMISSKFSKKKCINNQKKKKKTDEKSLNNAEKKRKSSQIIKRMKNKINISVDMLKIYFMTKSYVHELFSINSLNNIIKIENIYINNKMKYLFIFLNFNKVDTLTVIANDLANFIYTNSIKTSFIESFDLSCQYILNKKKNRFLMHIKDDININLNKNIINFFVLFKYNFLHDYFDYNEYGVFNQVGRNRDNSRVAIVKDLRKFIFYGNIFLREYVVIRNFTFYNLKYEYEDNVGYINKNEENLIVGNNLYLLNIYIIDGKTRVSKKIYIKRAIQSLNNSNNMASNKDDANFMENNDDNLRNNTERGSNNGDAKNKCRPILNEKNYLYIDVTVQENKRCINIYPYFFIHVLYSNLLGKKKTLKEEDVNRKESTKMDVETNDWMKLKFIKEECVNACLIKKNETLFSVPFNLIKKCKYIQLALKEDKKIFTSNKIKYKNIFNLPKYVYKDIYDVEHSIRCCFFYLFRKKEKKIQNYDNKMEENDKDFISKHEKKDDEIVDNGLTKIDEYENYYKIFSVMNIVKNNMHIISIESCIRIINLSPLDIKVLLKREKGSINTYSIKSFGYINVYEFNFLKNIILNFCLSIHRKWIEFIKIENENYFREAQSDKGADTFSKEHPSQSRDSKKNACHIISYKIIQCKNLYFLIYIYMYNNCYNIAFVSKYNIYNFTKNTLYYHLVHNEEECAIEELKDLSEIKKHKLKEKFNILKEHLLVLYPLIENEIIIDDKNLIKIKKNKFYNYSIDGQNPDNLIDEKENTKKCINNYCFNHNFVISNNSSRILNTDVSIYEINKSYNKIINLNDEYIKIDVNIVTIHSFSIVFIQFYPHIIIVNLTKYNLELRLKNNEELKKVYKDVNRVKKHNEVKDGNSYASCDSTKNEEINFSEQSEFSLSSDDEINKKDLIMANSDNKITNYFKAPSQFFDTTTKTHKNSRNKCNILKSMSMKELNMNDKSTWDYISFKIQNKGEEVDNDVKDEGYNNFEKMNINRFASYQMVIECLKKNPNFNTGGGSNFTGKKYVRCKYIKISKNMNKYFYMYKYKEIGSSKKTENTEEDKHYGIKEMLFNISCIEIKKTNYIFIKNIPLLLNYEMGYFQNGITIQYVSSESSVSDDLYVLKNEKHHIEGPKNRKAISCELPNKSRQVGREYTLKKKEEHVHEIEEYENYQKTYDEFKKLNLGMLSKLKKENLSIILKSYKEVVNNKIIKEGKIYIFNNLNIPIFVSPDKSNYLFYINKKYIHFKESKYFYFYFPKFILISKKLIFLFKTDSKLHEYRGVKNYMHIIKDDMTFQNFYVMKLVLLCNMVSTFQFYSFVFLRRTFSPGLSIKKRGLRKRRSKKEIVYFELYLVKFYCDIIINNNNEINIILNGINEWYFIKKILSINYFFNFLKNNKLNKYPKSISNITYINNMYGLNSSDLLNIKCFIQSMNLLFNFENISSNSENLHQKIYINKIHLNFYTFQYINNRVVDKKKRCIQFWGCPKGRSNSKTSRKSSKGRITNTDETNETVDKLSIREFDDLSSGSIKELTADDSKSLRNSMKKDRQFGDVVEKGVVLRGNNEIYNMYSTMKNKMYSHYNSFMFRDYRRNNKMYKSIFKLLKSNIVAVCFNQSDFYKKISITIDNISIKKVEYNYTILTKYNKNEIILDINIDLCKQTCMEYKHIYNTLNILYACSYINMINAGKSYEDQHVYKLKERKLSFSNILNDIKREEDGDSPIISVDTTRDAIIKKEKYNIFNSNNFSRNREHALLYNAYYFYKKNGKLQKNDDNQIDSNNGKRYKVKNLLEFIENIKNKKSEKKKKEIKNLSIDIASLALTLDYNYFINTLPLFYDYFCSKLKCLSPVNKLQNKGRLSLHMYYYYYLTKLVEKKKFEKLKQVENMGNYSYTNDVVIGRQKKEKDFFLLYVHNINIRKTKIYINVNYLLKLFLTKNFLMNISAINIQNKQKKNLKHILKKIKKIYFYNYISIFFYLLKNINISEHSSYTTLNFLTVIENFLKNNLQLSPLQNLYSLVVTLKYKCEHQLGNTNNPQINQDSYSINKKNINELMNLENNSLFIVSEKDRHTQDIEDSNTYFKNGFLFNYSNIFSMNIFSKNTTQIANQPEIHKSLMKKIMSLKERENTFLQMQESYQNPDIPSNSMYTQSSQSYRKDSQTKFDTPNAGSASSNVKHKDGGSPGKADKKNKSNKKRTNSKTKRKRDKKTNVQNITHISFTHNLNIKQ